jgi:MFS family permease
MTNNLSENTTSVGGFKANHAWYVVFILTLANISSFLDRQILALLVAPIKRDMHLSDTEVSLLMGLSFALFYTFFGIFIGHFADRFNRRNIIIIGISFWSIMTALCGGVNTYTQFFLARMGVGVGEATLAPSAYSMITDYFSKDKLARALSTYSMGIFLGAGFAILLGGLIVSKLPIEGTIIVPILGEIFHWQMLFVYIGLPGVVIALLLFTIKEPARGHNLESTKIAFGSSLKEIFSRSKMYLPITLGASFTAFASYGATAWIPTFFNRTFDWQMKEVSLKYGIVSAIFATLGVLAGGWLADRYTKRGIVAAKAKVGFIASVPILASGFIFLLNDPNLIIILLAIPCFFISFPYGASVAAVQEMMPSHVRALASSFFLFFVNMIGLAGGPYIVALFTDTIFADEMLVKYSLSLLFVITGVAMFVFYRLAIKFSPKSIK